jgi:hypothetical protein
VGLLVFFPPASAWISVLANPAFTAFLEERLFLAIGTQLRVTQRVEEHLTHPYTSSFEQRQGEGPPFQVGSFWLY